LEVLRGRQQLRINRCRPNCVADLPHRFAHGIDEGAAGIFHQVPAIRDLDGLRQRFRDGPAVTAAAVASNYCNLLLPLKPCLRGRRLAVWQQSNRLAPFEIADDRSVPLIAPPRPVINADHRWRRWTWRPMAPNGPEQGVIAHR
jgi:hypothetical protein